jgi:hypothetical protein
MSYLGNTPENYGFTSGYDSFNGDGTTVDFVLTRRIASVNDVIAVIENVIQDPISAYTIAINASGTSTITFTSAPPSGTNNIVVRYNYERLVAYNLVTEAQLQASSVTESKLAAGSVTNTKLGANSISGDKLGLNSVSGNNINYGGIVITGNIIGATSVSSNNIGLGAVSGNNIGLTAVSGNNIGIGAVSGNNIGLNAVSGNTLAANIIRANNIVPTTITGNLIAVGTITANLLTANAVSGNNIGYYAVGSNNMSFTGVTAANYGGSSTVPTISVDGAGRVTYAANVSLSAIPSVDIFTSGSGTWTIPAGVTKVKVTVVGGGGNSSGGLYGYSVSGGAGGGTAIKWLSGLTPGKTLDYTVGAATAASQVVTGASNGQTITSIVGSAGSAGTSGGYGSGDGGSASGGDLNIAGQRALGLSADGAVYGGGSHFAAAQFNVNTAGNIPGGGAGPQSSGSTISGARGVIIFEY